MGRIRLRVVLGCILVGMVAVPGAEASHQTNRRFGPEGTIVDADHGDDDVAVGGVENDTLQGPTRNDTLDGTSGSDDDGGSGRDACPAGTSCGRAGGCLPRWAEDESTGIGTAMEGAIESVTAVDLTGDGRDEAVVVRMIFQTTRTFPIDLIAADGTGGLEWATDRLFDGAVPTTQHPVPPVIADFNGDGVDDIFIPDSGMDADPFPGYQNQLVLSVPGGRVVNATDGLPQQRDQTHRAAAADVDGDGDVDLFVANLGGQGGEPSQIWLNDGDGGFRIAEGLLPPAQVDLFQNWYTSVGFVDADGDGDPDLVLGQGDAAKHSHVLRNDGTGRFTKVPEDLPTTPLWPSVHVLYLQAVEIDGDGLDDLVLAHTRLSYVGRYFQVLISNGDGTFRDETAARLPQSSLDSAAWPRYLVPVDVNYDGYLDVIAYLLGGQPLFYLNGGDGTFSQWDPGIDLWEWAFMDVNGDGRRDIVNSYSANPGISDYEFHLAAPETACLVP